MKTQQERLIEQVIDLPKYQVAFTNYNEKEQSTCITSITMLRFNNCKSYLALPILSLLTLFSLPVRMYWSVLLTVKYMYSEETRLQNATHLLINGKDGNYEIVKLEDLTNRVRPYLPNLTSEFLMFEYRFIKFLYQHELKRFEPVLFITDYPFDDLRSKYTTNILTKADRELKRIIFGKCEVDVPPKSFISLLVQEVLNPFYIFQVFAIALWTWDGYRSYAICIFIVSSGSVIASLYENITNNKRIRQMARYSCPVNVRVPASATEETGKLVQISSADLVPGDVIQVPEGMSLPCDLVLLTGSAIVNEAMLTGESIPVIKASLPVISTEVYSTESASKYTLFGGTSVIQTRNVGKEAVYGLVTSIGFLTTKGSLVRDILYPKEIKFRFYDDGMKFVGMMAVLAILGFLSTLPIEIKKGTDWILLLDRSLDLITITVPPALPAAMTCGVVFAINRLKLEKIFCISPMRINLAGRVTTFTFDKTGTLTEDGLSIQGFLPAEGQELSKFREFQNNVRQVQPDLVWWLDDDASQKRNIKQVLFVEAMVCCTAITYVNDKLVGDPLDVKMFEATEWVMEEPHTQEGQNVDAGIVMAQFYPKELKTFKMKYSQQSDDSDMENARTKNLYISSQLKRFEFSSALQRMSAICKNDFDGQYRVFVKGSPEKILELCLKETIPTNFNYILEQQTNEGYRVIALATKALPDMTYRRVQICKREEVECDLIFLGLVIMENKLKAVTSEVIKTLQDCKIRTIMATGDNVLTAISVARQCKLLCPEKEVFLGEVVVSKNKEVLKWTSSNKNSKVSLTALSDSQDNSISEIKKEVLPWSYTDSKVEVAITGKAFNLIMKNKEVDPFTFRSVCAKAQVFARMSPDDKEKLIMSLQEVLEEQIGMCGDGANDCGALKAADVGISLSEAEASIAAPFTSQVQDIRCVITLLREGRCAMTTSFQAFKFIELYSLIQFFSMLLLYSVDANMTNHQFLYTDLIALVPLSIFQARTGAYEKLNEHVPTATLFYFPVIASVISCALIQGGFLAYWFVNVLQQPFFVPPYNNGKDDSIQNLNIVSYQDTVIFMTSNFQYLFCCCSFSIAYPFRKNFWTNWPFTLSIVLIFTAGCLMVVMPASFFLKHYFDILPFTDDYNYTYWVILSIVLNMILTYSCEKIIVSQLTYASDRRLHKYKKLEFDEKMLTAKQSTLKHLMNENNHKDFNSEYHNW